MTSPRPAPERGRVWIAAAVAVLMVAAVVVAGLGARDAESQGGERWRALTPAPLERTEVAAARIGRQVYVVGGFERRSGQTTAATERYNLRRDRWAAARAMPLALNHPAAVAHRGRLYVHGGYRAALDLARPSAALLEYDPARRRWRRLPASPTPRAAHALAAIDGRLYAAGGANDSGSLRSLEVYDIRRRRWRRGPAFPGPARNHTTGVASGGRFYVLAGRDAVNYADAERYDPGRRRWQRLPDLRTPRGGISSVRLPGGRIVVFGGEDLAPGGTTIPEVELFDPRRRRWRRLPDMRTPRHGLGGVAFDGRVLAIAGGVQPGFSFSNTVEALRVR